jgi:hypothetical protein
MTTEENNPQFELLKVEKQTLSEKYTFEKENYSKLWRTFTKNVLKDDFTNSRRAGLALLFVPSLTNLFFVLVSPHNMFKNIMRVSSVIGSVCYFQHHLNIDLQNFVIKDNPDANQARVYLQNISFNNKSIPDFGQQTLELSSRAIFNVFF